MNSGLIFLIMLDIVLCFLFFRPQIRNCWQKLFIRQKLLSSQCLNKFGQLILGRHTRLTRVTVVTVTLARGPSYRRPLAHTLRALALAQHHLTGTHVIHRLGMAWALLLHSWAGHAHLHTGSRRPDISGLGRTSNLSKHLLGRH